MSESSEGIPSATDPAAAGYPPRPAESRAWGSLFAGLVGGLVAATLLILALHYAGWLDRGHEQIDARLTALERLPASLDETRAAFGASDQTLTELGQRVAALESRPAVAPPPPVDLAPIQAQVETLRGQVDASRNGADQVVGELRATVAGLAGSMAELRATASAAATGVTELRSAVSGVTSSLDEQRARLTELAQQVEALSNKPVDFAPVTALITTNTAAVDEQRQTLATLTNRVDELEKAIQAQREASARGVRLAAALVELDRAVSSGEPLAPAMDRLDPVVAEDGGVAAAVEPLKPLRDTGAPTVAALQEQLASLRPKAAPAGQAPEPENWLGQATQNLGSLVDVHETGAPAAATDQAVTKASDALASGDVAGAVAAVEAVAQDGDAAVADWLAKARARLDAEAAVERLREHVAMLLDPAH